MRERRVTALLATLAVVLLSAAPTGALATATATGSIGGTVTGPGGVPVEDVYVFFYPDDSFGGPPIEVPAPVLTAADGTYLRDALLPGPWNVVFDPPVHSGLDGEWYDDAGYWEDPTPVPVASGATSTADAELASIPDLGSITGTVTLPDGGDPARTIVLALGHYGVRSGGVASDGSYSIEDVHPGTWYVGYLANPLDHVVNEFYQDSEMPSGAAPVVVTEGSTTSGIDADLRNCSTEFADVDPLHQFCVAIEWLADTGAAAGFADGTFRPTRPVTRAAAASFLWKHAGSPSPPPGAPTFTDVPPDHPFAMPISWLASEGVTTGYDDGTFRPNVVVSRQAAAAFIWRLAGEPTPLDPLDGCIRDDVCDGHPFLFPIAWMLEKNIASGYADFTFRPTSAVTRQAMASFLREYQYVTEEDALAESFIHDPS